MLALVTSGHNASRGVTVPMLPEVLRASMEAHSDTFKALLNLTPAKYYLVKDDGANVLLRRLGPSRSKSIIDLQSDAALKWEAASSKVKGKWKATALDSDFDDAVQVNLSDAIATTTPNSQRLLPIAKPDGIAALRDKLHLRMEALRRSGQQRKQCAALREK
ncbi:hypothetical protein EDB19DRAFT_2025343 [Suillus lakei]|nr:hypothetical protein EDB19DRAFT_2025343 [Suillus lakei]